MLLCLHWPVVWPLDFSAPIHFPQYLDWQRGLVLEPASVVILLERVRERELEAQRFCEQDLGLFDRPGILHLDSLPTLQAPDGSACDSMRQGHCPGYHL